MNSMTSRPKKSPSLKGRSKVGTSRRLVRRGIGNKRNGNGRAGGSPLPTARAAFRAWRAGLPTALERDTLLWPEAIAESVVAEASRYLGAELPADFPARLAAKAYHLYPRHRHFHEVLNRPGNRGRHNLYVYMRHWTASWLKRQRSPLFRRLPWEYALGHPLPVDNGLTGVP